MLVSIVIYGQSLDHGCCYLKLLLNVDMQFSRARLHSRCNCNKWEKSPDGLSHIRAQKIITDK